MEDIEIIRNQRDILFNACKSVVKDKKCPDWISKVLTTAALNAKQLQKDVVVKTEMLLSTELKLDAIVRSNISKDNCIYKIVKVGPEIQGVQLYDVVIVKGNANNPENSVIHNVPSTSLVTVS
jgi:hypothetical protein